MSSDYIMTMQQAQMEMELYKKVFTVVRLLDKREFRLEENDKDSGTLLDMVSDPSQNTESASDSVYLQELHNTLTAALGTLSIRECEIIYARFYKGQTLEEIGDTLHCSKGNIDCHIQNAFRKLRRGKYGKELASFLPDQQERRAIRNINRESERKTAGLSEQEKELLL